MAMSILFKNPTVPLDTLPTVADIPWIAVEFRYRNMILLRNLFVSLILIPMGIGLFFIFQLVDQAGDAGEDFQRIAQYLVGGGACLLIAYLLFQWYVMPFLEVPRMKYAVRLQDINYRRGVFSTKTTSAPFRRMQHAETNRGPLERMFDLASLSIFTAAGLALQIRGLSPDTAETLRDHVLKKISEYQQLDAKNDVEDSTNL